MEENNSEKSIKEENKEVEKKKETVMKFLGNKDIHTYLLIALLIFAFILRLMYFNIDQAVWWDGADYLTGAKVIGQDLPLNHYEFNPRRPFFLSVFWARDKYALLICSKSLNPQFHQIFGQITPRY